MITVVGALHTDIDLDIFPSLSGTEAVGQARRSQGERLVGPVEFLILPLDERYALAYYFHLRSPDALDAVFVDAATGKTLLRYNDLRTDAIVGRATGSWSDAKKMSVDRSQNTHRASDLLRPAGIKTVDVAFDFDAWFRYDIGDSKIATDPDNDWNDGAVVDAHTYSGYTYDYYFKRHRRCGLDDRDLVAMSFVHIQPQTASFNNAFFDPVDNSLNYGDGDGILSNFFSSALDVVAHGFTHGVTQFSSDLIFLNESGALNEAFSDIMSAAVEFFIQPVGNERLEADWVLGEDLFFSFGSVVRDMANPGASGLPDHYSKRCLPPICAPEFDNGGVHINSSIGNHAFYLLVEGGTNRTSNITVNGLGRAQADRAEAIFYRAFVFLMTPSGNFSAARATTLQAARELYGEGSREEREVARAWDGGGGPLKG